MNPLGSGHLAFRVDDIAAVRARLDAEDIPYSDMGEWAIKGWHQLFCADPDGRVIEFYQVLDAVGASATHKASSPSVANIPCSSNYERRGRQQDPSERRSDT